MSWDREWSVETWLESLGLGQYTEPFLDNGYDLQELCANIKPEDLDAIGVEEERHRTAIFSEASKLRDEARARFKKSKGGGSSGSTDHSGSMGSGGSFPAYSEPWGEDAQKHVYSEVWEQQTPSPTNGASGAMTPALAQLMQQNSGEKDRHKGHTFPPAGPAKTPRKKPPVSPISQTSFTLPVVPRTAAAGPSSGGGGGGGGGLNKLQLKLKVLEELQKDRIILSEAPYCKEDGSMDEEKVSELCRVYSERFHIDPPQIMDTIRLIFKPPDTKDEPDGGQLFAKKPPVLATSDAYEEPFDVMRDDLSTFKESSPPSRPKRLVSGPGESCTEPVDHLSSPQKKGKKKDSSPQFLQKPKPSSSESSPEQRRCGSPRASPQPSPSSSPKEHKRFGLFTRKTKKKAARSNSLKEKNLTKTGGKAGKAVLISGKSNESAEDGVATPSGAISSRKRAARPSLSLPSPPSPPPSTTTSTHSPSHRENRTVSVSSNSTTGSEPSPLPPKKIGFIRFSQRSPKPQQKAKIIGQKGKDNLEVPLTASDMALDRVGVGSEPEGDGDTLRGAQSHEDLTSQDSPATAQRRTVESRERRGLFGLLRSKRKTGRRGRKGRRGKKEEEEEEEERNDEGPSFLTASISMPNIASAVAQLGEEDAANKTLSPLHTPQLAIQPPTASSKSSTAPPKPSRQGRSIKRLPHSPDTSPLPQRRVQQSEGEPLGNHLIPIQNGTSAESGGKISNWSHVSPSHLLQNPPQSFDSDSVFSSSKPHEPGSARTPQRDSLASYHSAASDTAETREKDLTGSVESRDSSVFGGPAALYKTSSGGSMKKPQPPPKPKTLERGRSRGSSDPQPTSPAATSAKEERKDGGIIRTNERVAPPQKPPRPNRGSVKQLSVLEKQTEGVEEESAESGGKVVPPPKPVRRHRSMKEGRVEQEPSPQKKALTMQSHRTSPQTSTSSSSSVKRPGTSGGVGGSVTPRRPVPTPKPRSSLSQEPTEETPPLSVGESVAAKLSEEGIDLTLQPYSTMWGLWGVPALLVFRYAQELDHPPEEIALLIDDLRIQHLKKRSRDCKPMRMPDALKNTDISTDTISSFLTSIGLPMYTSALSRSRGYFNVPSLRRLTEARLEELGIAPNHRGLLLEQIRRTK